MSRPLDETQLAELRDVMGDALVSLIETFIADGERRVSEIEAATQDDALRRSSHGLKGASANLGAIALAEACATLESLARSGERGGRAAVIANVRSEFECARAALRRYVAE